MFTLNIKCGFLDVPFRIYSIDIVDSTHDNVLLLVTRVVPNFRSFHSSLLPTMNL